MSLAIATLWLTNGQVLQKPVGIGGTELGGPLCLHLFAEVDGTISGRLSAGVAGTGQGGVVGVRKFTLDFSSSGVLSVACWPERPCVRTAGAVVTLWDDGKVHAIGPRGAVRFRMLTGANQASQVRDRLRTRQRAKRQIRLTPQVGIVKQDMPAAMAASILTRMENAMRTGVSDPGVQLDREAFGMHHGLGRLQSNEGGGVLLDFTAGSGDCALDLMRSDRVSDRHNVDYLDPNTLEPLHDPMQVDGSYNLVAGTNKSVVLPEFWMAYPGGGDNRIPRIYSDATGCTYLAILCGTDPSGDSLRGFDCQHAGRKHLNNEPASEQWGDQLAQFDRAASTGDISLQYTNAFINALGAQVNANPGQGHGFIGRREVGWAKDAMFTDPRTVTRATALSAIGAKARMKNGMTERAEPAPVGDPNSALAFNPSPWPPQGTLSRNNAASQVMEAVINAFSDARVGNARVTNLLTRRLFVDERYNLIFQRKSYLTLFGGMNKHVAVAPAGGAPSYFDPAEKSGGPDYFDWVALALGLWIDDSYTARYRTCSTMLALPTNPSRPTSFADAAVKLRADIGQEQTGLFIAYANAHP